MREYVGGRAVELIAGFDAVGLDRWEAERACAKFARERVEAVDAPPAELDEQADLVARAALAAAGYAQHKRGEWRKARGRDGQGATATEGGCGRLLRRRKR